MSINFQELFKVVEATEKLPLGRFNMRWVFATDDELDQSCGTVGCMIGHYNAYVGRGLSTFGTEVEDWVTFGITEDEYQWLFAEGLLGKTFRELATSWGKCGLRHVSRKEAIARLRKFIYYKLHKQEMIVDEKYGVRDEARHAEGNHNFAQRAKAEALALATA